MDATNGTTTGAMTGTWAVDARAARGGIVLEHSAARIIVIRCDRGAIDARFDAPGGAFRHLLVEGESASVLAAAATVEPRGVASSGRYEIHA